MTKDRTSSITKTITFDEASKSKTRAFSTLVKPVGASCNLRCSYCYYLDKTRLYPSKPKVMSPELLDEYIRQYIEANDVPVVTFCWHGGEPLMAELDFYRRAIALQKRYAKGKNIENTLQTNGTLVTEEWATFFADNNFLIGLSLDGPEDIHDAYRRNIGGEPTFAKVMKAVELLTNAKCEFNTLSVVNNLCEGRGVEVYNFFKSIGSRFMQFLPAVERVEAGVEVLEDDRAQISAPFKSGEVVITPWSVSPEGFGQFMIDIFEEWKKNDIGEYFVQLFDVALAQWVGVRPGLCAFAKSCGDGLVVECNGDVYSCDHFVYPEYLLGNISTDHLRTMYDSRKQFLFGISKRQNLPDDCLCCRYYFACTGGCPKHRFTASENGTHGVNYLCKGYKMFFEHVAPTMEVMARELSQR